jgi:GcrA cell cycle regulator
MATLLGRASADCTSGIPARLYVPRILEDLGDEIFGQVEPAAVSRPPRRRWTPSEIALLQQRYVTTEPVVEIANAMQRSKGSVYGKARRLQLRRPPRGKEALCSQIPPPLSAIIALPVALPGPQPIRTKIDGWRDVWFNETCERLMRLWVAGFHSHTIAEVLGPKFTRAAVRSKAPRLGLPRRPNPSALLRDVDDARRIDQEAAPLPRTIKDAQGKELTLKRCAETGQPFYAYGGEHKSPQFKQTKAGGSAYQRPGKRQAPCPPAPTLVKLMPTAPAPVAATMFACFAHHGTDQAHAASRLEGEPCCWPIGEPGTSGFGFCSARALKGKPYCEAHSDLAYTRPRRPAQCVIAGEAGAM